MKELLSSFHLLVELEELVALRYESLVVGMAPLRVLVHQIVNEAEDFQEHGESVLAHEAQLDRRVEECLPELVVTDLEATCASKHIASQFLLVREHEMAATVARSVLPVTVCLHLA